MYHVSTSRAVSNNISKHARKRWRITIICAGGMLPSQQRRKISVNKIISSEKAEIIENGGGREKSIGA